jgi:hypothetical protein
MCIYSAIKKISLAGWRDLFLCPLSKVAFKYALEHIQLGFSLTSAAPT